MGHSCRESPDDEPETPEPSDEFMKEWIEDERNWDFIIDHCFERIDADWIEHLLEKKNEAQESRAEARAQARKDS
jgi:hypothetical protein